METETASRKGPAINKRTHSLTPLSTLEYESQAQTKECKDETATSMKRSQSCSKATGLLSPLAASSVLKSSSCDSFSRAAETLTWNPSSDNNIASPRIFITGCMDGLNEGHADSTEQEISRTLSVTDGFSTPKLIEGDTSLASSASSVHVDALESNLLHVSQKLDFDSTQKSAESDKNLLAKIEAYELEIEYLKKELSSVKATRLLSETEALGFSNANPKESTATSVSKDQVMSKEYSSLLEAHDISCKLIQSLETEMQQYAGIQEKSLDLSRENDRLTLECDVLRQIVMSMETVAETWPTLEAFKDIEKREEQARLDVLDWVEQSRKEAISKQILQEKCDHLEQETLKLQSSLSSLQAENKKLEEHAKNLESNATDYRKKQVELQGKLDALKSKLQEYVKSLLITMTENASEQPQNKTLNFAESFKQCANAYTEMKQKVEDMKKDIKRLGTEKSALVKSLKASKEQVDKYTKENVALEKSVEELRLSKERTASESKVRVDELWNELQKAKQEEQACKVELTKSNKNAEQLKQQLTEVGKSLEACKSEFEAFQENQAQEKNELNDKCLQLSKTLDETETKLKEQMATFSNAVKDWNEEKQEIHEKLTLNLKEIDNLNTLLQESDDKQKDLEDQVQLLQNEIQKFETAEKEFEERIDELQSTITQLENELSLLSEKSSKQLCEMQEDSAKKLEIIREQLEEKEKELENTKKTMHELQQELQENANQLIKVEKEKNQLLEREQELLESLEETRREMSDMQKKNAQELELFEMSIHSLKSNLDTVNKTLEEAENMTEQIYKEKCHETEEIKTILDKALKNAAELTHENSHLLSDYQDAKSKLETVQEERDSEKQMRIGFQHEYEHQRKEKELIFQTLEETRSKLETSLSSSVTVRSALADANIKIQKLSDQVLKTRAVLVDFEALSKKHDAALIKLDEMQDSNQSLLDAMNVIHESTIKLHEKLTNEKSSASDSLNEFNLVMGAETHIIKDVLKRFDHIADMFVMMQPSAKNDDPICMPSVNDAVETALKRQIPSQPIHPDSAVELLEPLDSLIPMPTPKEDALNLSTPGNVLETLETEMETILERMSIAHVDKELLSNTLKRYIDAKISVEKLLIDLKRSQPSMENDQAVSSKLYELGIKLDGISHALLHQNQPSSHLVDSLKQQLEQKDDEIKRLSKLHEEKDAFVNLLYLQATDVKKRLK